MAVPEKILFVIDRAQEKNCTPFYLHDAGKYTSLFIIKRVVQHFVCLKSAIQRRHEYGIMTLNSKNAEWICDFTSNHKTIINHLDCFDEDIIDDDQKSYDFGPAFDMIREKVVLPVGESDTGVYPFVVRIILIYARSNVMPTFEGSKEFLDAIPEKSFFIDVLYVHEPESPANASQEIYCRLAQLFLKHDSYIFETGRNTKILHDNMAKLLGHPLQRKPQKMEFETPNC